VTEESKYCLGKSAKGLGKLTPILKDAHGNIIDGFHRQNEDPDWEAIQVGSVDSPQKLELARLAVNFCRRTMGANEIQNRVAFLVGKCGMKPEEIAELTGISRTTIYKYMPQELKDEKKAEAGKLGGEAKAESFATHAKQIVKIYDAPPERVECQCCTIGVYYPKKFEGVNVCSRCYDNLEAGTAKLPKQTQPTTKKIVEPPKIKESWAERKAHMQPQVSSMEQKLAVALSAKGVGFESQKQFCLQSTTPDFFIGNTAFYIDGSVHVKRQDRDEYLRELLAKRHGVKVVSLSYETDSQQEQDRLLGEILREVS